MTPEQFNDTYWAAQHPDVRALRDMTTPELKAIRENKAAELAARGFKIHRGIMAIGWDAFSTMSLATTYSLRWMPSLFQQSPDYIPFMQDAAAMPDEAIPVSLDPADYPPFIDPPPPPPADEGLAQPGDQVAENYWAALRNDLSPLGTMWGGPRGKFIKRGIPSPFGGFYHAHWERI